MAKDQKAKFIDEVQSVANESDSLTYDLFGYAEEILHGEAPNPGLLAEIRAAIRKAHQALKDRAK